MSNGLDGVSLYFTRVSVSNIHTLKKRDDSEILMGNPKAPLPPISLFLRLNTRQSRIITKLHQSFNTLHYITVLLLAIHYPH